MARVALVTGGTRGIGAAVSVALKEQGRIVIANYAGNDKAAAAFHEETGIESNFIRVAGFLDAYETGTGYAVLPVVGLLSEGFALVPNTSE